MKIVNNYIRVLCAMLMNNKVTTDKNRSFTSFTLWFCLAGLLVSGFTIYGIVGLQLGIEKLGIECTTVWTILWTITAIGAIITPFIFVKFIYKKLGTGYNFASDKILVFNIIEMTFIQSTLGMFFTNGQILCYGNGGQNGLEFIFTGWLSLPFLILFSVVFDRLRAKRIQEIRLKRINN